MIPKTVLGNAMKGAYQDFLKKREKKKRIKENEHAIINASREEGWEKMEKQMMHGSQAQHKEYLKKFHDHKDNGKGYCKTCGKDMTRKEKLPF